MARILVTGASGRIGLSLVADLVGKGHTVRALIIPRLPLGRPQERDAP